MSSYEAPWCALSSAVATALAASTSSRIFPNFLWMFWHVFPMDPRIPSGMVLTRLRTDLETSFSFLCPFFFFVYCTVFRPLRFDLSVCRVTFTSRFDRKSVVRAVSRAPCSLDIPLAREQYAFQMSSSLGSNRGHAFLVFPEYSCPGRVSAS